MEHFSSLSYDISENYCHCWRGSNHWSHVDGGASGWGVHRTLTLCEDVYHHLCGQYCREKTCKIPCQFDYDKDEINYDSHINETCKRHVYVRKNEKSLNVLSCSLDWTKRYQCTIYVNRTQSGGAFTYLVKTQSDPLQWPVCKSTAWVCGNHLENIWALSQKKSFSSRTLLGSLGNLKKTRYRKLIFHFKAEWFNVTALLQEYQQHIILWDTSISWKNILTDQNASNIFRFQPNRCRSDERSSLTSLAVGESGMTICAWQ